MQFLELDWNASVLVAELIDIYVIIKLFVLSDVCEVQAATLALVLVLVRVRVEILAPVTVTAAVVTEIVEAVIETVVRRCGFDHHAVVLIAALFDGQDRFADQ